MMSEPFMVSPETLAEMERVAEAQRRDKEQQYVDVSVCATAMGSLAYMWQVIDALCDRTLLMPGAIEARDAMRQAQQELSKASDCFRGIMTGRRVQ